MSILVAEKNAATLLSDEVVPWDAEVDGVSADSAIAYLMACTVCKPYAPAKPSGRRVMYEKLIGRMRKRIHVSCSWRPHILKENVGDRFSVDELQAAVDRRYGVIVVGGAGGDDGSSGGSGGGVGSAITNDSSRISASPVSPPQISSSPSPSSFLSPPDSSSTSPSPTFQVLAPSLPRLPAAANSTMFAPTSLATLAAAPAPPPSEPRGPVEPIGGDAQRDAANTLVLMLAATSPSAAPTAPRSTSRRRATDRDAGSVPAQTAAEGAISIRAAAAAAAADTAAATTTTTTTSTAKRLRVSRAPTTTTAKESQPGGRRQTRATRPPETPDQKKARRAAEKKERAEIERAIREAEGVRRTARSTRPIGESEKEKQARMEAVKKQWRENAAAYARQRNESRRLAGTVTPSSAASDRNDVSPGPRAVTSPVGSVSPPSPTIAAVFGAPRSPAPTRAWPLPPSTLLSLATPTPPSPPPSPSPIETPPSPLPALPSIDEMARAFRIQASSSDTVSLASTPTDIKSRGRTSVPVRALSRLTASPTTPLDAARAATAPPPPPSSSSLARAKRKSPDQCDRSVSPSTSPSLSSSSSSFSASAFSRSPFQIVTSVAPQIVPPSSPSSSSLVLPTPTVRRPALSPFVTDTRASARHTQGVPIDVTPFHAHFGASADARRRRRVRLKTLRDHARRFEVDLEALTKPTDSWSDTESATTTSSSSDDDNEDDDTTEDVASGKIVADADRNSRPDGGGGDDNNSQHRTARMREISNRLRRLVCASIAF